LVGEEIFTCFKFISSKLEPGGGDMGRNDEEVGIAVSGTFG